MFEQGVINPRDFVGRGGDRFATTGAAADAPIESPQGSLGAGLRNCGHAKSLGRSVSTWFGLARKHAPTGLLSTRAEGQPRGKVLDALPGCHIEADFAGERQQSVGGQTGDAEQIDAAHFVELIPDVQPSADAVARENRLLWGRWLIVSVLILPQQIGGDGRFTVGNLNLVGLV